MSVTDDSPITIKFWVLILAAALAAGLGFPEEHPAKRRPKRAAVSMAQPSSWTDMIQQVAFAEEPPPAKNQQKQKHRFLDR